MIEDVKMDEVEKHDNDTKSSENASPEKKIIKLSELGTKEVSIYNTKLC